MLIQPLWKTIWGFFKSKNSTTIVSRNPTSGYLYKENKSTNSKRCVYPYVHWSIISIASMFISRYSQPKAGSLHFSLSWFLSDSTLYYPKFVGATEKFPTVLVECFDQGLPPCPSHGQRHGKGIFTLTRFDVQWVLWTWPQQVRGLTTQWAAQRRGEWDKCGAGCRPCSWILVQCLVQLFSCHRDSKPPLSSDLTQRDRAPGLCVGPHSPTPLFASKPRKSSPSSIRKQRPSP